MKKEFTKQEIIDKRGCYSLEQVGNLSFINNDIISIETIINSEIPLKDKRWFIFKNCELTIENKKELALKLAWCVLPIYENKYPNDLRVRDCLQAINDFNDKKITIDELREKRNAASAAYADAYATAVDAAVDAVDAVDAAYYATASAAVDAAYATASAYYAVDAASSAQLSYTQKIINIFLDFF